jgi:hypothetical protein
MMSGSLLLMIVFSLPVSRTIQIARFVPGRRKTTSRYIGAAIVALSTRRMGP